ncbi:MAG: hypothetical protein H5T69_02430 [Chloroflexi bacterium]|nr:hypothetical protein [Chloroflexota bacterium]
MARERGQRVLDKPGWEKSLRRWQAFWAGEMADRPPIQIAIVAGESLDTGEPPSLESTLARFDPLRNEPILEAAERALARRAAIPDDNPPAMQAGGGVYFTGAVFGAPVKATADMMTAEPILKDWGQLRELRFDLGNAWVQRALSLARQLVARSGGRYAVTPGLLEGPSDICAALRGITRLAGDLYQYPNEVTRLAELGAEAWERYMRTMHEIVPLYDGGTVTQWSVWTPGRGAALQEDFCTIISPNSFRRFFAPLDARLAATVDTAWIHVHAGAIHLVEPLLEIDALRAIQIVHDGAASPPMERLVAAMQQVQAAGKRLIVRKFSPVELEQILPRLSLRGLAIDTYLPSEEAARRWLEATW